MADGHSPVVPRVDSVLVIVSLIVLPAVGSVLFIVSLTVLLGVGSVLVIVPFIVSLIVRLLAPRSLVPGFIPWHPGDSLGVPVLGHGLTPVVLVLVVPLVLGVQWVRGYGGFGCGTVCTCARH